MSKLIETLHDNIDFREELRDRAAELTKRAVEDELDELLESMDDFRVIFQTLAMLVEDNLTELTTEAVKGGVEQARKRRNA